MNKMTEPNVSKEMILKLIEEHEEALKMLRACKLWHSMGETFESSADMLEDFPNTMADSIHHADIMYRSINRVYGKYFREWMMNNED